MEKNKHLKICIFTSAHPRYDIRIFIKQAKSFARAGYDTTLLVADGQGNEKNDRIKIFDIGAGKGGRIGRMTMTVLSMFKKARSINADSYHFHDPELIPVGLLLKLRGKKVVYDVHEDYPRSILSRPYLHPWLRKIVSIAFEMLETFAAKKFAGVSCATPWIGKRFKLLNDNTEVIQNFPILGELQSSEYSSWEKRPNKVAYVGVISDLRGAKEMVEAAGYATQKTRIHLLLGGKFDPQSYKTEIEQLKGWKQTEFVGFLSRKGVASLFGRIKAGLVLFHPDPNHIMAQPNKLFEYMSAGIPVIASDFIFWREVVTMSGCGLLVDPLNPVHIAEAITKIIENPEMAEEMGKKGRQAVEKRYNWQIEEKKLLKFYHRLI